jgi:UDP-glucose 4-epimerase
MRCLVFGGNGFLGSDLCTVLLAQGYDVRVFERPLPKGSAVPEGVEWYEGDFTNEHDVEEAIQGCDVIFHLISTTLPKSSNENPIYDVQSNIAGTIRMLNLAVKYHVKKVVFTSSGGTVYGIPHQDLITETHPTEPICSYGITKLAIEKYLYLFYTMYGLNYVVMRISNPYGKGLRANATQGAVGVFIERALSHKPIEIWGDGKVVRDYIHVSDVSTAMLAAIDYEGEHRVINISSGCGASLNDILNHIEGVLQRPVERTYQQGRAVDVPINVLSNKLAQQALQWHPQVSLYDGIRKMVYACQSTMML